ncbi:MAG: hypothetical protein AAGD96_13110 [Chloroflexota bacterium]
MTERSIKLSSNLTQEDQLELLKDSIDLRFSSPEINEFSALQGEDTPYKPRSARTSNPNTERLPIFAADMTFNHTQEYYAFKRQLRYICSGVILLALLSPYLTLLDGPHSLNGIQIMTGLLNVFTLTFSSAIWLIGVAIFPIMLCIYAGALAIMPKRIWQSQTALTKLWSITATSGILYFFAAFVFSTLETNGGQTFTNTIGIGYYIAMATIFAYHFLTQLADQTVVT